MANKIKTKNLIEGLAGEKIVRDYLSKYRNCFFMQLDIVAKIEDNWYSIEVKHQEMFKAPPFDGHGLPSWQVKRRIQLYDELGIIPLFFVLDMETKDLLYGNLVQLDSGKKFKTKHKSRIIYPITSFIKLEYDN